MVGTLLGMADIGLLVGLLLLPPDHFKEYNGSHGSMYHMAVLMPQDLMSPLVS
jgi:hypothetical protein